MQATEGDRIVVRGHHQSGNPITPPVPHSDERRSRDPHQERRRFLTGQ